MGLYVARERFQIKFSMKNRMAGGALSYIDFPRFWEKVPVMASHDLSVKSKPNDTSILPPLLDMWEV